MVDRLKLACEAQTTIKARREGGCFRLRNNPDRRSSTLTVSRPELGRSWSVPGNIIQLAMRIIVTAMVDILRNEALLTQARLCFECSGWTRQRTADRYDVIPVGDIPSAAARRYSLYTYRSGFLFRAELRPLLALSTGLGVTPARLTPSGCYNPLRCVEML